MSAVQHDETCTCYCTECWHGRDDCVCEEGPSGEVSRSCETCGWLA